MISLKNNRLVKTEAQLAKDCYELGYKNLLRNAGVGIIQLSFFPYHV